MSARQWLRWLLPCLAAFLTACATPSEQFDIRAAARGFERHTVTGDEYTHAVFRSLNADHTKPLHVYLAGDGSPWKRGRWPSADPTPRSSVTLDLMALDPNPSLLLGRPCYHGLSDDAQCSEKLWTHARYSPQIVRSMIDALKHELAAARSRSVVLIGYSGGGALAMLMAEHLGQIRALVTIAANLELAAWATHHEYEPLAGSLSPADVAPLGRQIVQLHLTGSDDSVVPPEVTAAGLQRQPHAQLRTISGFDHRCCWASVWPSVIAELAAPSEPQ